MTLVNLKCNHFELRSTHLNHFRAITYVRARHSWISLQSLRGIKFLQCSSPSFCQNKQNPHPPLTHRPCFVVTKECLLGGCSPLSFPPHSSDPCRLPLTLGLCYVEYSPETSPCGITWMLDRNADSQAQLMNQILNCEILR